MSKYRKSSYKQFKFGDFLANTGNYLVNNLDAIQSGITGQDFYDPNFKGKKANDWEKLSDVQSKYLTTATGMAANYFVPGATTVTKGLTSAINPNGTEAQTIAGLDQAGSALMSSMKCGGKLSYKPMAMGGNLTHIPESSGTHEENPNGGVDLSGFKASVEGGETINQDQEYVYSNSLLLNPELVSEFGLPSYLKNKTFATASKLIEKKFPRNDRFDKLGKERLMNRLTEAQEAYKDQQDDELMEDFQARYEARIKKLGGKMYKKYVRGGTISEDKKDPMQEDFYTEPSNYVELPNGQTQPFDWRSFDYTGKTPTRQDLITAGQLAPIAFNTIEGIRKADRLDPEKYQVKGRYTPFYYNPSEELRAVNDAYATGVEAVRGASGGNAGTYLSNMSSMFGNKTKATADIYNRKYNLDNQANAAAQAGNISIEGANNQSRFQTDDWNMRSLQAKRNALSKASYDLSEYADGKNQEEYWKELSNLYGPDFSRYMQEKRAADLAAKKATEEAAKKATEEALTAQKEGTNKYGGKLKRYKKA
jgi:hypothetical protein